LISVIIISVSVSVWICCRH